MTSSRNAALADAAAVVLFVLIGRRSHDEGAAFKDLLETLAPFAIGMIAGWTLLLATGRPPAAWRSGVVVWAFTIVGGMFLRHFAFDRSTATSFIVVATCFLGLFLLGWRLAAARLVPWGRRRAAD